MASNKSLKEYELKSKYSKAKNFSDNLNLYGNKNLLYKPILGIVGSRNLSDLGYMGCAKMVEMLSRYDLAIASGLMYGADIAAHELANRYGLKMIGVLPYGLQVKPPSYAKKIYEQIRSTGLLLSEFASHQAAAKWTFVKRNETLVSMCNAVLVVEGQCNSGTMHTAKFCIKLNVPLYVLSHSILHDKLTGYSALLKIGAQPIWSASILTSKMNLQQRLSNVPRTNISDKITHVDEIVSYLNTPKTLDELSLLLGSSIEGLLQKITILEMEGKIKLWGGKYHAT